MAKGDGTASRPAIGVLLAARRAGPVDRFIGARIEAARKARHLSAQDLGRRLGFTAPQMRKYEAGASRIPAATLLAISQIVDVPVARFLPETALGAKARDDEIRALARSLLGAGEAALAKAFVTFAQAYASSASGPRVASKPDPVPGSGPVFTGAPVRADS